MNPEKESNFRASLSKANEKIFAKDMIKIQKDKHIGRSRKTAATILNVLCRQPKVTITNLVNITKIPRPTITNTVKKMVDIGIMHPTRPTKSWQMYYYSSVLGTAKELSSGDIRNQTKQGCYLSFAGREEAINRADIPTKIKFKEDVRHNKKYPNSPNSLYVCDNVDLLKYLIQNESEPFQLIFLDPPFDQHNAYRPRSYQDTFDSHSEYLSFMYERLLLCKKLLADNGLIVIAIGEDSLAHTKLICNEIFNERNFINCVAVESGVAGGIYTGYSKNRLPCVKQYSLLIYAKQKKQINFLNRLYDLIDKKFAKEYNIVITKNLEKEPLMNYLKKIDWVVDEFAEHNLPMSLRNIEGLMQSSQKFETFFYETISPILYKEVPYHKTPSESLKKCPQNKVFSLDDKLLLKKGDDRTVEFKPFANRVQDKEGTKYNSLIRGDIWKNYFFYKDITRKQSGITFEGRKPVRLIQDLLYWINNKNSRCLDLFGGGASFGFGIFKQNKKDSGHRSFVMCQIEEPIKQNANNPESFSTIDQKTIFALNNSIEETGTTEGYKIFRGAKS